MMLRKLRMLNVIWQQIQSAKKERKELHVTFLDLANAYGSVPHELLWAAFDFFRVPMSVTKLVKVYFDFEICNLVSQLQNSALHGIA